MKSLKNPKISLMLFTIIVGLSFSMNSIAQKSNFSGTFKLNESKSTLGDGPMRPAFQMIVNQDDSTLTTERKSIGRNGEERVQTYKYTLDGKICENKGFMNNVSKSKVTWSANQKSLTINTTIVFNRDGESMEMKSNEIWTISADGSTLNIESTRNSPMGEMKLTLVYDKTK